LPNPQLVGAPSFVFFRAKGGKARTPMYEITWSETWGSSVQARLVIGHDFRGCGKPRFGWRRGFNPRIKPTESMRALAPEGLFSGDSPFALPFSVACLAPCGNAGIRKGTCSDSPRPRLLNCSAPRQNGEIVNRCNHLRFEEDDQFNGDSTAAFRINDSGNEFYSLSGYL
jgi:hypothetical protein